MSIVKKGLNRSDVYLTDYNSRRSWEVTGSNLIELGVKLIVALSSSRPYLPVDEDLRNYNPLSSSAGWPEDEVYNQKLVYGQYYELFYGGSQGDGTFSGSKDWSLPSSLTLTGSRTTPASNFKDSDSIPGFVILTIPKEVFGTGISPSSLTVDPDEDAFCYVESDYMINETGSICDEGYPLGTWTRPSDRWVDPYFENLHTKAVFDFEGLLIGNGFMGEWHQPEEYEYPTPIQMTNAPVGDVIYAQGQVVFTNNFLRYLVDNWGIDNLSWESNKPVFTEHVTCKVRDIDFNRTYNPSATEELQNTPGFTPYVTSVGLYNTEGDLIAVAKLSKPIKKALDTEITFDIQIDLG